MSLIKYAAFAIQDAWIERPLDRTRTRTAHRHQFQYEPRSGYLYVRSRAISSRCNDNYDEFPGDEIKQAYRTFIGKPVFVNHRNDDHRKARGVIIDAALHEDTNPDNSEDTWVEVLMEVDAVRFPKLAQAILAGEIDRTSMGTDVAYSVCSFCGNRAATPLDYCRHIPKLKGQRIRRTTASGQIEDVLVREICHGLSFFENSLLVEDPADPTAFFLGVDDRGVGGGYSGTLRHSFVVPTDRRWEEGEHPRDTGGKFTEGQGQNQGPSENAKQPEKAQPESATDGSGSKEDPIQTDDVEQAAKALMEGKFVNLKQPRRICTLLGELKAGIEAAKNAGENASVNLCNVTVQGTNLFCVETKGIPRIKMPQLKAMEITPGSRAEKELTPNDRGEYDLQPAFFSMLRERGVRTSANVEVLAAHLKASQNELNAAKIAGITESLLGGESFGGEEIFVSNDDYIVDGHHRWAGTVSADWNDGDDDDMTLPVHVIDMDIISLLAEANRFAREWGIPTQGAMASKKSRGCQGCRTAAVDAKRYVCVHRDKTGLPHLHDSGDGTPKRKRCSYCGGGFYVQTGIYGAFEWRQDNRYFQDAAVKTFRTEAQADEFIRNHGGNLVTRWIPNLDTASHRRTAAKDDVLAPTKIDTMRQDTCPVCGEKDSYADDKCAVCGFNRPPDFMMDPDLEKAKQQDLRQEKQDIPTGAEKPGADTQETTDSTDPSDLVFHPPGQAESPAVSDQAAGTPQSEVGDDGLLPNGMSAPADATENGEEDEDQENDADEEEGSDDNDPNAPDFLKKKPKKKQPPTSNPYGQIARRWSQKEQSMRPTLAALAEQQMLIEAHGKAIDRIAQLAGIDLSDIKQEATHRVTALHKKADEENPAQPIPEPAQEAPAATTAETLGDLNSDDVTAPGSTSVTDVSPAATTNLADTGTVLDEPLDLNEQDPTKPVAGTTDVRPLDEVKTETEVRIGEGDSTSTMFPLQGPFTGQPKTTGSRTYASLRLARLRLAAGIETGDDLAIGEAIDSSAASDEAIQAEIETLSKVVTVAGQRASAPRNLVPQRTAGAQQRTAPSMAGVPSMEVLASAASSVSPDEVMFEG